MMTPAPDALLRAYVADTGLTLEAVALAFVLEDAPNRPHATERLTNAEREELATLTNDLDRVMGWVTVLSLPPGASTQRAPVRPPVLPTAEAAMLRKALRIDALLDDPRAVRINDGAGVDVWASALVISPTLAALNAKRDAILARCILTPDERRDRITAALTRTDGTVARSPADWCAARGVSLAALRGAALMEWWERGSRALRRPSRVVRVGTAALVTYTADKPQVKRLTRRAAERLTVVDAEKRRLFQASEYRGVGAYEKLALVSLANLAWDAGLLDGYAEARRPKRVVDSETLAADTPPPTRLTFRFPGYTEMARRVGAKPDADGRIPQHYTRNLERAFQRLSKEARWIAEPVRVYDKATKTWRDDALVRQALWIEVEGLVGADEVLVHLHAAAATSMLASWEEYPSLLEQYETARKQIGARQLRDDFVACEDYLTHLRNANEAQARTERPATDGATEADRVVWADVSKERLWEKMGWDKEARKRGKRHANKLARDALAFCEARGVLISWKERGGKKGPVLDLELRGSRHADPSQGTLFLPGGGI